MLLNMRGFACGWASFRLMRDTIDVLFDLRSVCVADRDNFREWLTDPDLAPYHIDDATWSAGPTTPPIIYLKIRATAYYRLADADVTELRSRV